MSLLDDIKSDVSSILNFTWDTREGKVVPQPEDVALLGGGVELDATMLYADLIDSTALIEHNRKTAARVFKCFLGVASRIIRSNGGHIRSFDGDRVMGVFIEGTPNTSAAKCALQINWAIKNVITPELKNHYNSFKEGKFSVSQVVGIDRSKVLVVRGGIAKNNDLVWVGKAANFAAKLSSLREDPQYKSYISKAVYDSMLDSSKFESENGTSMWEERSWKGQTIYRSNWRWQIK